MEAVTVSAPCATRVVAGRGVDFTLFRFNR
jgi:hypothetical protein